MVFSLINFLVKLKGKFQSSFIRKGVPPSMLEVGLGLEGGLPAGQRCLACLLGLLLQLGVQPLDHTLGQSQLRKSTQVPSSGPLGTGFVCALGRSAVTKCCTQYASKFGKLSSGRRTGKDQFSFQSQRKAMPKNVQTTAQLHSFYVLAK